jgi:hypothetical protein
MSTAAPVHGSSRQGLCACDYSVGQRFTMSLGDVQSVWPQWAGDGGQRHKVRWRVVDNTRANDRLACKYTGRSAANRVLIGNGGVTEFALTHRFASSRRLFDLLGDPTAPAPGPSNSGGTRYHQIPCKRFRDGPRPSAANVSQFTEHSQCPHCNTGLFEGETSALCCYNGKFVLPTGRPNPPELETLLNNRKLPL